MKRASAWPLLVIVLVVGNVFAGLVFYDIIIKSESKVDSFDSTLKSQNNRMVALQQQLDDVEPRLQNHQNQIDTLNEEITSRDEQIAALATEINQLENTVAQIPQNVQDDSPAITVIGSLSILAIILVVIEFITR